MIKPYSREEKIRLGLSLLMVLFLVLFTNRLDHQYYSSLEDSLKKVYDDRLQVQDYILSLNKLYHKKQLTLFSKTHEYEVDLPDEVKVNNLIIGFSKTNLSRKGSTDFDRLNHNIKQLRDLEESLSHKDSISYMDQKNLNKRLSDVQFTLDKLSDLQIEEGKEALKEARSSIERNALITRIEYIVLIAVSLLLQFLFFNRSTKK